MNGASKERLKMQSVAMARRMVRRVRGRGMMVVVGYTMITSGMMDAEVRMDGVVIHDVASGTGMLSWLK